jgi:hypothetical protein
LEKRAMITDRLFPTLFAAGVQRGGVDAAALHDSHHPHNA